MGQAQAKASTGARKLPYVGAITEGVREVLLRAGHRVRRR